MDVVDSILRHEGFRAKPYIDPLARRRVPEDAYRIIKAYWDRLVPTFGHGLTYITEDESRYIVAKRAAALREELSSLIPVFKYLPKTAQDVLIEMSYQLGVRGVLRFRNMIAALNEYDYNKAADEMLDSRWARQTPERAHELANRIRALA